MEIYVHIICAKIFYKIFNKRYKIHNSHNNLNLYNMY